MSYNASGSSSFSTPSPLPVRRKQRGDLMKRNKDTNLKLSSKQIANIITYIMKDLLSYCCWLHLIWKLLTKMLEFEIGAHQKVYFHKWCILWNSDKIQMSQEVTCHKSGHVYGIVRYYTVSGITIGMHTNLFFANLMISHLQVKRTVCTTYVGVQRTTYNTLIRSIAFLLSRFIFMAWDRPNNHKQFPKRMNQEEGTTLTIFSRRAKYLVFVEERNIISISN